MVRERQHSCDSGVRLLRCIRLVLLSVIVLTASVIPAAAETRVQSELDTFATFVWTGEELGLLSFARGQLDFRSPRGQPVQGHLQLRTTLGDAQAPAGMAMVRPALLEVPRASIRFRFPITDEYSVRVTSGRDRLTWGIGSLFNAADLLFGADGTAAADFTEIDDVRDETAWLSALYFPIGELSYLEAVALPPLVDMTISPVVEDPAEGDDVMSAAPGAADAGFDQTPPLAQTSGGLRLHTQLAGITIEPSYLWDGSDEQHNLAVALQGGFGADFYIAGRLALDADLPSGAARVFEERATLSAGVFRRFDVARDRRLTGRFETLMQPAGKWEDQNNPEAEYAILLYPELVFSPGRTLDLIARSVVSPIDESALITGGVSWNVFGGFRAQAFAGVEAGDKDSIFAWDRPGSVRVSTGFNYLF